MGIQFDRLVNFTKRTIDANEKGRYLGVGGTTISTVKGYLEDLIKSAILVEFLHDATEIFPRSGKDFTEYARYVLDFFQLSKQNGAHILTPFPLTAIEDNLGVVFMYNTSRSEPDLFRVIDYKFTPKGKENEEQETLLIGTVKLQQPDENLKYSGQTIHEYSHLRNAGRRLDYNTDVDVRWEFDTELVKIAANYVNELVYIMDPAQWIVQRESNASKKQRAKMQRSHRTDLLLKTVERPGYIVLSTDEVRTLFSEGAKEPNPAHPVSGYWRTLISERYTKMRGQTIQVEQYFTGNGYVEARGGWHYQLMIKKGPTELVPYKNTG